VKVLIATDGSEGAVAAAQQGLRLTAPDATVLLLAIAETPPDAGVGFDAGMGGAVADTEVLEVEWEAGRTHAEGAIQRTAQVLGGRQVESRIEPGDPAKAICEVAAEEGVDVVVIGSRGHGRLRRALLGSVSTHVIHHAPCPVLVVRST
jgi:nucleotide-binding universal stress UspA family protein